MKPNTCACAEEGCKTKLLIGNMHRVLTVVGFTYNKPFNPHTPLEINYCSFHFIGEETGTEV